MLYEAYNINVPSEEWTTLLVAPVPHDDNLLWAAYLRCSNVNGVQYITRFIRLPEHDHTGAEDRLFTPGKQYVSRVWPFKATEDVGIQIWHDAADLHVEYVQLKWKGLGA